VTTFTTHHVQRFANVINVFNTGSLRHVVALLRSCDCHSYASYMQFSMLISLYTVSNVYFIVAYVLSPLSTALSAFRRCLFSYLYIILR